MDRNEIAEVRRTWELASANMPLFAELFCIRMKLIDTRRRVLLGEDAETRARMLLRLVGIAVNGLNQPRILYPLLETLGRQSAWRIVSARQSCVVIRALLWSLKATLGSAYSSTARRAWIAGFRTVARTMAVGMNEAARNLDVAPEFHPVSFGKIAVQLMRGPTPLQGRELAA